MPTRSTSVFCAALTALLAHFPQTSAADLDNEIRPLLQTYCLKCHTGDRAKAPDVAVASVS